MLFRSRKIKFLEKSRKVYIRSFCIKRGREPPGMTQGGHHATSPWLGTACSLGAPKHGEGPLALHLLSHLPQPPLPRRNTSTLLKPEFLLFFLAIFDLLVQPTFSAEIWGNCSLVCDSSDDPSRILFSGVFLAYFVAVGDRFSELACLFDA